MNPVDLNPNPPAWLASVVSNEQADQDHVYGDAAARWSAAVASWVSENVDNRARSLPITAPPSGPPIREILYANNANAIGQYDAPLDSNLPKPILPPAIPTPASTNGFSTGAPAQSDTINATYALVQKIAKVMGIS